MRLVKVSSEGGPSTCCFMLHQSFDNNLKFHALFLALFSVLKYSIYRSLYTRRFSREFLNLSSEKGNMTF